jgi:hypothetical protein
VPNLRGPARRPARNPPCASERRLQHHIVPRSQGGADAEENLITLCDLCHAVVTWRWWKPWFPTASLAEVEAMRVEFEWFLHLPLAERKAVRLDLLVSFGR